MRLAGGAAKAARLGVTIGAQLAGGGASAARSTALRVFQRLERRGGLGGVPHPYERAARERSTGELVERRPAADVPSDDELAALAEEEEAAAALAEEAESPSGAQDGPGGPGRVAVLDDEIGVGVESDDEPTGSEDAGFDAGVAADASEDAGFDAGVAADGSEDAGFDADAAPGPESAGPLGSEPPLAPAPADLDVAAGDGDAPPDARSAAEFDAAPPDERAAAELDAVPPDERAAAELDAVPPDEPGAAADAPAAAAAPAPAPPVEGHVDTGAELVAELAESGAEEGAGAEVEVAEPWQGYAGMTAAEVRRRLAGAEPVTATAVLLYERANRGRKSVVEAAERRLAQAQAGR